MRDNMKARIMQPDGTYRRAEPAEGDPLIGAQEAFLAGRPRYS
jgi:hypothetical protein